MFLNLEKINNVPLKKKLSIFLSYRWYGNLDRQKIINKNDQNFLRLSFLSCVFRQIETHMLHIQKKKIILENRILKFISYIFNHE